MDTKIIELRMAVKALPTDNTQVQLAVKAEVLRLAGLIDAQIVETQQKEKANVCVCGHAEADHDFYDDHDECEFCECENGYIKR